MSKIFNECDWEDDLPSIGTNFSFSRKNDNKKQRDNSTDNAGFTKQGNKQNMPIGWSVLISKQTRSEGDEGSVKAKNGNTAVTETNGKGTNPKSRKRKAPQTENVDNDAASTANNGKKSFGNKKSTKNHESSNLPRKDIKEKVKNTDNQNGVSTVQNSVDTQKKDNAADDHDLRNKLVARLKGSRFRFINEQLYKTTGEEAKKLFQEDPDSFTAYHEGYRHQIAQWSMNPLDRIIKSIKKLPKDTIVADFGCGEARLAQSIPNQTYSLDLVSHNSSVIACDMANTPLESNYVNVVVFCLSLMGTNLVDFLLEANRVLKVGGLLKIAEVSSRFDNVNEFVANVKKCGFALVNKDTKHKLFYFINFKKERTVIKGSIKIKQFSLKPCLYKKR
ncbi:ribosomal RNA-processing protein 8 [Anopheles ziemanni]|uniref:ribosomal RNA-processing protein 8 n=1 Tax=Anopheles coustani TaxID=139045 RepID=UPI0026591AD5|nr:ribosomal RNA-processing protein 8 [Anopheles coustani]XP_058170549.1 ribosomal RNA-processing protein 8 [Anopheles ziemanni]